MLKRSLEMLSGCLRSTSVVYCGLNDMPSVSYLFIPSDAMFEQKNKQADVKSLVVAQGKYLGWQCMHGISRMGGLI